MKAFYSSTDDKDDEGCPGLHAVIGQIDVQGKGRFEIITSIMTKSGERMHVEPSAAIELEIDDDLSFHPNVLGYVKTQKRLLSKQLQSTVSDLFPFTPGPSAPASTSAAKLFDPKPERDRDPDFDPAVADLIYDLSSMLEQYPESVVNEVFEMVLEHLQAIDEEEERELESQKDPFHYKT